MSNITDPQYPGLKITGVRNDAGPNGEDAVTEEAKSAFVAETPEAFVHDLDGNLKEDARWTYTCEADGDRLLRLSGGWSR